MCFSKLTSCTDENIKEDVLFQHQENNDHLPPDLPVPGVRPAEEEDVYERVEVKKSLPEGMTFYKKPVKKVAF